MNDFHANQIAKPILVALTTASERMRLAVVVIVVVLHRADVNQSLGRNL